MLNKCKTAYSHLLSVVERLVEWCFQTPRRSRGNSKKGSTGVSTAAMPVLDAEDRFELGSCINLENSVSPEATPKKRPIAVVAPMTKHDSLESSDQRPGFPFALILDCNLSSLLGEREDARSKYR